MEKFAVDLDKVLNDFEYNEEHLSEYSSNQRTINDAYNRNYAKNSRPFRTPASDYRRPPFEPVNLADADFSVSTRQPVQSNYVIPLYPEATENVPNFEQPIASQNFDDCVKNEDSSIENLSLTKSKDFKPDLIESNADLVSNLNEDIRSERHLPDIASTDIEVKDEKVNFDLISNSVDHEPEPADVIGADKQEVVRFPDTSDVSDSELHQYLEELDQSESTTENQSSIRADEDKLSNITEDDSKVLIKVEPEHQLYSEKTQVAVNETECSAKLSEDGDENTDDYGGNTTLRLDISTGDVTTIEARDPVETPMSEDMKTESSLVDLTDSMDVGNDSDSIETKILTEESSVDFDCKQAEVVVSEYVVSNEALKDVEPLVEESLSETNDSSAVSEITNESSLDSCDEGSLKCENDDTKQIEPNVGYTHDAVDKEPISSADSTRSDTETAEVSMSVISNDNQVPSSESNYQILDSKAAISTFERTCDGAAVAGCSKEESESATTSDNEETPKLQRPDSLNLAHTTQTSEMSSTSADSGSLLSSEESKLGKEQPFWIPDSESNVCMQCQLRFTLVKRRHHCRACGLVSGEHDGFIIFTCETYSVQVLCSKCCDMKAKLEYLDFEEARVCHRCHSILQRKEEISSLRRPNPNNPMEYCSTIPPPLQVGPTQPSPPSVLVPVSVLKREGRTKSNDPPKQVIFSDGIRPGSEPCDRDLTMESRMSSLRRHPRGTKRVSTPPGNLAIHRRMLNAETKSFIPSTSDLPPVVHKIQGEYIFSDAENPIGVDSEPIKFAINRNLFLIVKRILLNCCVNRDVWCMTTEGLSCVGQDEIVFLLEVLPEEKHPPKDVFLTVNMLYQEASKGNTVTEMSYATPCLSQLFGSKEHGGFVFIRPSYQCIQKLLLPKAPYLIALLIHRWETPWARLFPIRLVLRLGAEYRYYPCPLVSIRNRPALFTDIGHTIISLLADFRKYSYSLPSVRGLVIHMEDRLTTILLPRNRYDQVIRAMNNSEENVLAFSGNISTQADSHLVCIQSTQDDTSYTTQAINILNKPRQVTGASFIVFNGSLKQCAWAGKSNIVEDGLMVQIPSESMSNLRTALKQMKDYSIGCGPQAEEVVVLKWADDDVNFNIGVRSNIDGKPLDGVPSIRVHNGIDYSGALRLIRWTEVFILQSDEQSESKTGDTVNISKLSESIARASCIALVPLLDLLATANLTTIAVRATIHPENVGYEAGSLGEKLPPIYMKSLDETLIAVVHEAAVAIRDISSPTVLELIFKVMEQE